MKKINIMLVISMLVIFAFPFAAYADEDNSIQASKYIRSTSAVITPQGNNGILILENKLGATRIVDKLGIKTLEVQTMVNGYWRSIHTVVKNDYLYNTGTYNWNSYYYGTPGTQYRTYVEYYVENDGGSETRIVTSTPKIAK